MAVVSLQSAYSIRPVYGRCEIASYAFCILFLLLHFIANLVRSFILFCQVNLLGSIRLPYGFLYLRFHLLHVFLLRCLLLGRLLRFLLCSPLCAFPLLPQFISRAVSAQFEFSYITARTVSKPS